MFGSTVLEVATGLVFVFLLTSLVCTYIGNTVSDLLKWRAIELEKGIRAFIAGGKKNVDLSKLAKRSVDGKEIFVPLADIYSHPLIQALAMKETWGQAKLRELLKRGAEESKPINIPTQTFVLALFDTFVPGAAGKTTIGEIRDEIEHSLPADSPLKKPLLTLVTGVNDKVDDARKKVENWFDAAMVQTTEIYRRNMWRFALVIGILTSMVLNVDSISITSALWRDPALRASVSAAASQYSAAANEKTTVEQAKVLKSVLDEINKLHLPIGWQLAVRPNFVLYPNDFILASQPIGGTAWLLKILGWIVTGLAAAQGAPFWFDVLKKFTSKDTAPAQTQDAKA